MSTAYGFHMDFQFWVHLTMLGGFQMLQSPRITKLDLEQPEMVQNQIFLFQRLDFEYTQLLPSPVLKNLKFWTFWTPLTPAVGISLMVAPARWSHTPAVGKSLKQGPLPSQDSFLCS